MVDIGIDKRFCRIKTQFGNMLFFLAMPPTHAVNPKNL
ncbi:hypothetical protein YpK1973002_1061 [Yersinia pestis biovar Mediaevalis str. K1973002]|nr:hypothetical protein YpK1973002_1061 [Yersinia pestis biovar Mediaevalis str. K1973002]